MAPPTGPSPRVKAAFKAMKNLGIAKEKTKAVLKKLLELYDKNWDLIEAENYRVLADTIFEFDEVAEKEENGHSERGKPSVEIGHMQNEPMQGQPEPPINTSFMMHQGDTAPYIGEPSARSGAYALKTPKLEPREPNSSPIQCIQSMTKYTDKRVESDCVSPKQPVSPQEMRFSVEESEPSSNVSARDSRVVIEQASQNSQLNELTVEPGVVPSGKQNYPQTNGLANDELLTDEILTLEPLAVVHPGSRSDLL